MSELSNHDLEHLKRMFPENSTVYTVARHKTETQAKLSVVAFALDEIWHPTVLVAMVCKLKVKSYQGQDVIVVNRYENKTRDIAKKLGLALYGNENALKHAKI